MKQKILVLGYFGYVNNQLDGQTIKTRSIYDLLLKKAGNDLVIEYFDTQVFQHSFISVFVMILKIWHCNKLIYIPAHKNLKYLFPFIFIFSKIKKIEIIYFVVGGWLSDYLKYKKIHVLLLSKIRAILTESKDLEHILELNYKFSNVLTFPNFRIHSFVPELSVNKELFKIVFMARINKNKGIDYLFKLAEYLNNESFLPRPVHIDIYGPIENPDKEYFLKNLLKYDNITYKGILDPNQMYETLNKYDIMVFPTHFYTEGFPGTVLDAYISGLPIVATKWKFACDFIIDEKTGIIVPFENSENEFIEAIVRLYRNNELLLQMKKNAFHFSKNYSAENAWEILEKNHLILS